MMKKIWALVLAVVMIMTVGATAFAATNLGSSEQGVVGGSDSFATDKPSTQDKAVNIKKELTAYNFDETTINAPTITYSYKITAGVAGVKITDAATDHANSTAVTVQTKAGIIPGVSVTGSANGAANTAATAAAGATSVTNTIAWTPASTLTASNDGTANYQNLTIDFTNVVFDAAGVYRYVITETPHAGVETYAATGVTETTADENKHVRYLDVYVRPNPTTFTDGKSADDWDIYGYVCLLKSEEITDADDTATKGAVKTNGFVAGTNDETAYLADQYYTYNVTVSKTVTNDNFAKATHSFPFTVLFTNAAITQPVDIIGRVKTGTATNYTDPTSAALSANTTNGILLIKDSSSVKYIGIPNGTQIEVYETNDVAGVTYQVTTTTDGASPAQVDAAVISGTAPNSAVTQTNKAAYESTKTTITPTVDTDDDVAHTIAIDNNLQLISPTGVVLRIAPYVMILVAGIALLILAKKRKPAKDEE